jgi:hypothetical protein
MFAFGGLLVFVHKKTHQAGLCLWVASLALGYRTVHITANYSIHPSEVILWVLFILSLRELAQNPGLGFRTPRWLWPFVLFWILGWITGLLTVSTWTQGTDVMFSEFRNFLLLLPLGVVVGVAIARTGAWKAAVVSLFLVGTWIAFGGDLEYFFPSVAHRFPGLMASPDPTMTQEGFARASFSYWGSPNATMVIILCLPMAIVVSQCFRQSWQRVLIGVAVVSQVVAIYIGGYRSMWLTVVVQFVLWTWIRHGPFWCGIVAVPAGITYEFLGETAHARVASLVAILQGHPGDTSGVKRLARIEDTWNAVLQYPLGMGWGGAGWVHSDFLQVAANLGVLAGLLFAFAYLNTLWRLVRKVQLGARWRELDPLGLSLLLSFVAVAMLLAVEGVEVLPQTMLPVWFVWVLVEIWLQGTQHARGGAAYATTSYFNSATNLQLRRHRSEHA